MQPRRARRIDANQPAIVARFKQWGFSVHPVNGAFDLLVSRGGPSWPIEVKNPNQPPSKRKLTKCEAEFHAAYKGEVITVVTDEDVDEAVDKMVRYWLKANGVES